MLTPKSRDATLEIVLRWIVCEAIAEKKGTYNMKHVKIQKRASAAQKAALLNPAHLNDGDIIASSHATGTRDKNVVSALSEHLKKWHPDKVKICQPNINVA